MMLMLLHHQGGGHYTLKTGIVIENGDLILNFLRQVFHSQIKIKCLKGVSHLVKHIRWFRVDYYRWLTEV